jgi:hypothetical protein
MAVTMAGALFSVINTLITAARNAESVTFEVLNPSEKRFFLYFLFIYGCQLVPGFPVGTQGSSIWPGSLECLGALFGLIRS